MGTLLIQNIGLLQTPLGNEKRGGKAQGENAKRRDAAIFIEGGIIREITDGGKLPAGATGAEEVIDAAGRLVTPGLVDAHTHLVFGGYRQHEIPLKLAGAGYLDILKAGGGILDTVQKTREADFESLVEKSRGFLDEMLSLGVTTCEAKSGYGLDLATEEKQLRVLGRLKEEHRMDVVATFMGAHAVPPEYKGRPDAYIRMICEEIIPHVARHKLAAYCDVFCEDSVFNAQQSEAYLECARQHGLGLRIHADEIEDIGGSALAGRLFAASADHLIAAGEQGLASLARGGVTATLLPATSFYLDKPYAPARRMIELGIPVSIASDFNPGSCPSLNLQFAINLGYLRYKMTPEEVLTAITINPAGSIGLGEKLGTAEAGKQADLVIWNAQDMEMLCYRFGSNLVRDVVKKGERIQ